MTKRVDGEANAQADVERVEDDKQPKAANLVAHDGLIGRRVK